MPKATRPPITPQPDAKLIRIAEEAIATSFAASELTAGEDMIDIPDDVAAEQGRLQDRAFVLLDQAIRLRARTPEGQRAKARLLLRFNTELAIEGDEWRRDRGLPHGERLVRSLCSDLGADSRNVELGA